MNAKLTKLDREQLIIVEQLSHMGGSSPIRYSEYRTRERLRRLGLLKFWRRRATQWHSCFYDVTASGRLALSRPHPSTPEK